MDQQWHYTQNGQRFGPITWDALVQLGATGQLHPADLVWTDGMAQWSQAAQVSGLIPQLAGADVSTAAGFAGGAPLNYYAPPQTVEFAGFWLRFCASIIDWLIIFIPLAIINFGIMIALGMPKFPRGNAFAVFTAPHSILATILTNLVDLGLYIAYFATQESGAAQATIGKRAVGVYVTSLNSGRLSFNNAAGRVLAKHINVIFVLLSVVLITAASLQIGLAVNGLGSLFFIVTYSMAGFTARKQALHDMLAGTLVMKGTPQQ